MNYLVRLNLKTQAQCHRIIWTAYAEKGLPLNNAAAAYELYAAYIKAHPTFEFHSDSWEHLSHFNVKEESYKEEHEFGIGWGELEIKSTSTKEDFHLQIVSYEPITDQQAKDYRYVSDEHLNVTL